MPCYGRVFGLLFRTVLGIYLTILETMWCFSYLIHEMLRMTRVSSPLLDNIASYL